MASFILLQHLGPFAPQRSPTVLVFYAFIVTDVWDRSWPLKGPLLLKATRLASPKTKSSRQKDALREAYSKKETFQQRLLEGKNGQKLKHLLSCSIYAYFGMMPDSTNGQCILTKKFFLEWLC